MIALFSCCCQSKPPLTISSYEDIGCLGYVCPIDWHYVGYVDPLTGSLTGNKFPCGTIDLYAYITQWRRPIYSDGTIGTYELIGNFPQDDFDCSGYPNVFYEVQ